MKAKIIRKLHVWWSACWKENQQRACSGSVPMQGVKGEGRPSTCAELVLLETPQLNLQVAENYQEVSPAHLPLLIASHGERLLFICIFFPWSCESDHFNSFD